MGFLASPIGVASNPVATPIIVLCIIIVKSDRRLLLRGAPIANSIVYSLYLLQFKKLNKMKCDCDTEWTDKLQPTALAANAQTKKSTSNTPFYLMFRRNFDSSNLLNLITLPITPTWTRTCWQNSIQWRIIQPSQVYCEKGNATDESTPRGNTKRLCEVFVKLLACVLSVCALSVSVRGPLWCNSGV